MEDKHPEAITVELGGKVRRIKLGPAAFRLAKVKHGATISTAELTAPTLDVLAQLVWIGLLPNEPDLTEDVVLGWLAAHDDESVVLGAVMRSLAQLVDGIGRANAQGSRPFVPPPKRKR
jgi:hypothetical protein